MSQIYDMYRMVKVTHKMRRRAEKVAPVALKLAGYDSRYPVTMLVKQEYVRYRPWKDMTDAAEVIVDCISSKYLEGYTDSKAFNTPTDFLKITKKGRRLKERTLFLPTGLWFAWYKEDGKVFVSFVSGVIALLTLILSLLAKIVFF